MADLPLVGDDGMDAAVGCACGGCVPLRDLSCVPMCMYKVFGACGAQCWKLRVLVRANPALRFQRLVSKARDYLLVTEECNVQRELCPTVSPRHNSRLNSRLLRGITTLNSRQLAHHMHMHRIHGQ